MNDDRAREVLLAGPAAILMVILVAIIAVVATEHSGNSTKVVAIRVEREAPKVKPSTSTTITLPTTTTTAPILTTTTTRPVAPTASTTPTVPRGAFGVAPGTPVPPPQKYVPPPLPEGTSATISSCTWSNGSLRASGTATNNTGEDDSFAITVVWTANGFEIDDELDFFDIRNGQTINWSFSTEDDKPAGPFSCSVEMF